MLISHSLNENNLKDSKVERTIEVIEEVLSLLNSAHYFSKEKGKTLFILSVSKEIREYQKKKLIRKFKLFEGEEKKEYKSKSKEQWRRQLKDFWVITTNYIK